MEFSYREVATVSPEGKVTTERVMKEQWTGCACVFPGGVPCDCKEDCPCRRVTASHPLPTAFATPFGE
jgi:hypothetical protein